MTERLRIATFNLENLDDKPDEEPSLQERIPLMRPQLTRLAADVLCLQEVHGQKEDDEPRRLLALEQLLERTPYAAYHVAHTKTQGGEAFEERNLVVLSRREILGQEQYMNRFCPAPLYKKVTADPQPAEPEPIGWERPILHVRIGLEGDKTLHVFNVHLKSKAPTDIVGQNKDVPDPKPPPFAWRTAYGWAEGFFVSSMKRVGQALEARIIVDKLFDQDPSALIVVCGDFNADSGDVPVQAIRGDVENTGNPALSRRVLVPCEHSIPESARYSYLYHGKREMIDHLLVSRNLLEFYGGSQIHNELLHDESASFAVDKKYPESDHAPVLAQFDLP